MTDIKKIMAHAVIVLSGFFIVLMILDEYNPTKDFIGKAVSVGIFPCFCLICMGFAILSCIQRK